MDPVADAINSLGAILRSLQLTAYSPRFEASLYSTGIGQLSGTDNQLVFDIPAGKVYILKGFIVTAAVADTLESTAPCILYFYDDDDSDRCVAPIGAFGSLAAIGTTFNRDVPDLGSGRRGSGSSSNLKIGMSQDIGGGQIDVAYCVWGDEVPA